VQSHINLTGHITEMLLVIVSGPLWSRLSLGEREVFQDVFREACAKATAEIAASEIRLVDEFAKKYGKTVVKSDRTASSRRSRNSSSARMWPGTRRSTTGCRR